MIIDNLTNVVYFSELIKSNPCFPNIEAILQKHSVEYRFLKNTKDIWARDYMPIQVDQKKFIQFRYEPSYLIKDLHLQSNPIEICEANNIYPIFSDINLDGGNVVKGINRVLITDRIFTENPKYDNKQDIINKIETLFNAEVIIIPQIFADFTGHADGLVRFIDDNTILVNNLDEEYKYWGKAMKKVIDNYNLSFINIPIFEDKTKRKDKLKSAIGCYTNYLEIGNLIIFPIFEINGNKDLEALNVMKDIYPTRIIEPININNIALEGGLMNCISWNIKE